jgi:DNA-binding transcriptional LysR family regulator
MKRTSHPFSNASWDDVRFFLAALEHQSFTLAAQALGVGQATMSRRIAALEVDVGHALFDRSRAGLTPTHAALRLRPWAEAMGASMRDAAAALAGLEAAPEGRVRLACAPGVAVDFGPLLLRRLRVRYPKLVIELLADVRVRDLAAHEADLALRNHAPTSGPLVVKKLFELPIGLYASPALVRRLPARPRLEQVPLIDWSDELPTLSAALAPLPCPRVMVTNDFLAMCAAAEAGIGAMVTTSAQARLRGLARVEAPFPAVPPTPLYVVTHQALRRVPRVAAVLEVLDEVLDDAAARLGVSDSPSARRKATSPSPP